MPDFDRGYSDTADASGNASVEIRPRASGGMIVKQVTAETPNASQGTALVRKNGWAVTPLSLPVDAAAGDPPIRLDATDVMTVEFAGQPVGSECRVTVFWWEP